MTELTSQDWWTAPAEGDNGATVIVTGRRDVDKFREKGRHSIHVEVTYDYSASAEPDGFPSLETSRVLEQITDRLHEMCHHERGVVMTGIFTGENRRDWVFYTVSLNVFRHAFNKAMNDMPAMSFGFSATEDSLWQAYDEMKSLTEIEGD